MCLQLCSQDDCLLRAIDLYLLDESVALSHGLLPDVRDELCIRPLSGVLLLRLIERRVQECKDLPTAEFLPWLANAFVCANRGHFKQTVWWVFSQHFFVAVSKSDDKDLQATFDKQLRCLAVWPIASRDNSTTEWRAIENEATSTPLFCEPPSSRNQQSIPSHVVSQLHIVDRTLFKQLDAANERL